VVDLTYIILILLLLPFINKSLEYTKIISSENLNSYKIRIGKLWVSYVLIDTFLFFSFGEIFSVFLSPFQAIVLSLSFFCVWILVIVVVYFLSFSKLIKLIENREKNKQTYKMSLLDVIFSLFVLGGMIYALLYAGIGLFFGYKISELPELIINFPSLLSIILVPILIFPYLEIWINGKKLLKEDAEDA